MEEWQSALAVAAIAAVTALIGAVIGRERWPADLRDAKRLGEIVDRMDPKSKEREVAAMYRDDLASRWIIGRVVARTDIRRELGLILVLTGLAISATGVLILAVVIPGSSDSEPKRVAEVVMVCVGWVLLGVALLAVGVWLGNAYIKRWNRYLAELRAARGMREPVAEWVKDFDLAYKHLGGGEKPRRRSEPADPVAEADAITN